MWRQDGLWRWHRWAWLSWLVTIVCIVHGEVVKIRIVLAKKYSCLVELDPNFGIWEFSAIVALFFERPKIKLILTSSLMAIFIWNLHAKSFFIFLTYTYCLYYTSSGHNKYFRLCFKWVFVSSWSSSMCRSVIKVLIQQKSKTNNTFKLNEILHR